MKDNSTGIYVRKELGASPTPKAYLELGRRMQTETGRAPFSSERAHEIALFCFRMAVIATIAAYAQNLRESPQPLPPPARRPARPRSENPETTPPGPPLYSPVEVTTSPKPKERPKPELTPEQQEQRRRQRETEAAWQREKYIRLSIALVGAGSVIFAFVLGFIG